MTDRYELNNEVEEFEEYDIEEGEEIVDLGDDVQPFSLKSNPFSSNLCQLSPEPAVPSDLKRYSKNEEEDEVEGQGDELNDREEEDVPFAFAEKYSSKMKLSSYFDSEEPDLSHLKDKSIGGGKRMGQLALCQGKNNIDLRQGLTIEKTRKEDRTQFMVIQHLGDYKGIPDMIKQKRNPLMESLTVEQIKNGLNQKEEKKEDDLDEDDDDDFNDRDPCLEGKQMEAKPEDDGMSTFTLNKVESWITSKRFERWIIIEGVRMGWEAAVEEDYSSKQVERPEVQKMEGKVVQLLGFQMFEAKVDLCLVEGETAKIDSQEYSEELQGEEMAVSKLRKQCQGTFTLKPKIQTLPRTKSISGKILKERSLSSQFTSITISKIQIEPQQFAIDAHSEVHCLRQSSLKLSKRPVVHQFQGENSKFILKMRHIKIAQSYTINAGNQQPPKHLQPSAQKLMKISRNSIQFVQMMGKKAGAGSRSQSQVVPAPTPKSQQSMKPNAQVSVTRQDDKADPSGYPRKFTVKKTLVPIIQQKGGQQQQKLVGTPLEPMEKNAAVFQSIKRQLMQQKRKKADLFASQEPRKAPQEARFNPPLEGQSQLLKNLLNQQSQESLQHSSNEYLPEIEGKQRLRNNFQPYKNMSSHPSEEKKRQKKYLEGLYKVNDSLDDIYLMDNDASPSNSAYPSYTSHLDFSDKKIAPQRTPQKVQLKVKIQSDKNSNYQIEA